MIVYPIYEIYINKGEEKNNLFFKKYNGIKNTHYHLFFPVNDDMHQMTKDEFNYCKQNATLISKENLLSFFKDSYRRTRTNLIKNIKNLNVRDTE